MSEQKTVATIGKFRVIQPKKEGHTPTLVFNVHYAAPHGVSFLKSGFRLNGGKLDAPTVSLGPGRYFETAYVSRRVALDIYDALLRAAKAGDWPADVAHPITDVEAAIEGILYENWKAAQMLGLEKVVKRKKEITYEPYKFKADA